MTTEAAPESGAVTRHGTSTHTLCQMGTFALAVWGARQRGTLGLLAVGVSALMLGYNLGRTQPPHADDADTDSDREEPTPESAELGTTDAGPP